MQRSRKILYKPRMADSLSPLRQRFFQSLHEASELLRLFEFLPRVYLYVKDADGRFESAIPSTLPDVAFRISAARPGS